MLLRIKTPSIKSFSAFLAAVLLVGAVITPFLTASTSHAVDATPWNIQSPLTAQSIGIGTGTTCGINGEEQVYCWGYSSYGQHGTGETGFIVKIYPVAVDTSGVLAGKTMKQLSVGGETTCGIASDDQAYCWGAEPLGSGTNNEDGALVPVAVDTSGVLAGKTIKQISVDNAHGCVIASDDQVYCWGSDYLGSLGDAGGTTDTYAYSPVAVYTGGALAGKTVKSIASNRGASCVLTTDNQMYCWGDGQNAGNAADQPVRVGNTGALAGLTIKAMAPSDSTTCVIASDDQAYCWGRNTYGQLGNGDDSYADSQTPVAVDTSGVLNGKTLVSIQSNGSTICVLASDGSVYCWGSNENYLLGLDESVDTSNVPVLTETDGVVGGDVENIYIGFSVFCVATSTSEVYCRGDGTGAQLGNGFLAATPVLDRVIATPGGGTVTNVSFDSQNGKQLLIINGSGFGDAFTIAFNRSAVSLNGEPLKFCSDGFGLDAAQVGSMIGRPDLVTDTPACYLIAANGVPAPSDNYTDTRAVVWLPDDFDIDAPGTVSVNGSAAFSFNQSTPPEEVEPSAVINGGSLGGTPTIPARPVFSGTAEPGSTVVVTVHSDPVTCTTTADSFGNWSCTLPADLPAGQHTVFVEITSPSNVVTTLGPFTVNVTGTDPTVLAPNTGFLAAVHQAQSLKNQAVRVPGIVAAAIAGAGTALLIGRVAYIRRFQKKIQ